MGRYHRYYYYFNQFQQELEEYINKNAPKEGKYTCLICNKNLVGSDKTSTTPKCRGNSKLDII
jgi:hypothetical protein